VISEKSLPPEEKAEAGGSRGLPPARVTEWEKRVVDFVLLTEG